MQHMAWIDRNGELTRDLEVALDEQTPAEHAELEQSMFSMLVGFSVSSTVEVPEETHEAIRLAWRQSFRRRYPDTRPPKEELDRVEELAGWIQQTQARRGMRARSPLSFA